MTGDGDDGGRDCLIIVHLSSLDTYLDYHPEKGRALTERLSEAIEHFHGLVLVLDEEWGNPTRQRKHLQRVLRYRGGATLYVHHDENCEIEELDEGFRDAWQQLEHQLPLLLHREGVTRVIIGGFWWFRDGTNGCVNEVEKILNEWRTEPGSNGFLESVSVDEDLVGEDTHAYRP